MVYSHEKVKLKGAPQKKKGWNTKAIATQNFEGRIEELKGNVFGLHGLDQSEISNRAIKDITNYLDQDIDTLVRKALRNLRVPIVRKTNKMDLDQGESTMDNVDKAIFQEDKSNT